MENWESKNRHKYLLQYHLIFVCKYIIEARPKETDINSLNAAIAPIANQARIDNSNVKQQKLAQRFSYDYRFEKEIDDKGHGGMGS